MANPDSLLGAIAHVAAIATALVAAGTACWLWFERQAKRRKLEDYLKTQKEAGKDKGQRSILHLMCALGLTEAEILQASFRSKKIKRRMISDKSGIAAQMLLEYQD